MATDYILTLFLIIPLLPVNVLERLILESNYVANFLFPTTIIFGLISKDIYNGRSIGKRLKGYQVVDSKSNQPASVIQSIIRNLTFLIWPIEALLVLGTPEYRIGDYLAKTKVIKAETSDPLDLIKEI